MNRYFVTTGFNTKQLWVYDEVKDAYINPPAEVLDKINEEHDWNDWDSKERALEEIVEQNPSWLNDEEYTYPADDYDI